MFKKNDKKEVFDRILKFLKLKYDSNILTF